MAAATLSAGSATPTGKREATLAVTSNQATGTVYVVVTASSTAPSHAQIVAGTDDSDAPALYASSKAGALSNSFSATGIERTNSRLYAHFTQKNAGNENSTPVSSNAFWLHDVSLGTLAANGDTSIVTMAMPFIRVSGTFGSGTITFYYKDGGGNWIAISDCAFTSAGQKVLQFARPVTIKATLSGATNPTLAWEVR